jgi:NADPH:quinone reductase
VQAARDAGAHDAVRTDARAAAVVVAAVLRLAPQGVDHVVEVAFDTNVAVDEQVLALGGSIAAYATGNAKPELPFWNLLFKNARILLLGSDDFPVERKLEAAHAANELLASGWTGVQIEGVFPLADIAAAHQHAESRRRGRTVLSV